MGPARNQKQPGPSNEVFGFKRPAYKAFDFVVTAWHLVDWTYGALDDDEREYTYQHLIPGTSGALADFKNKRDRQIAFFNAVTDQFPVLKVCHDLANGGKHGGHLTRPQAGKIKFAVRRHDVPDTPDYSATYTLHISIDGVEQDAMTFFESLVDAWEGILSRWEFIEDPIAGRLAAMSNGDDL